MVPPWVKTKNLSMDSVHKVGMQKSPMSMFFSSYTKIPFMFCIPFLIKARIGALKKFLGWVGFV